MSLFEDSQYVYRDTFFVFFSQENRPNRADIQAVFKSLGSKYETKNLLETDDKFDSITVSSPQDYSAMDIVLTAGEDVKEQIREILTELKTLTLTGEDREKLKQLTQADCRFDVYHFGQVTASDDDEDDFLDPGGLMAVLDRLVELTQGVSYDPQSQSLF